MTLPFQWVCVGDMVNSRPKNSIVYYLFRCSCPSRINSELIYRSNVKQSQQAEPFNQITINNRWTRISVWTSSTPCAGVNETFAFDIWDCTEQKRRDGCHLLMHFQKQYRLKDTAILCGITFENPSINVEPERKGLAYGGFVETHPSRTFCSLLLIANHLYCTSF